MAKFLYRLDRENEVIVQGELLTELEINVYDKKLGRFTAETKEIREVMNSKIEALIDLENLRLLDKLNLDFKMEAELKGEKHFEVYRIKKAFDNSGEVEWSKQDIYSLNLETEENGKLYFIVDIL